MKILLIIFIGICGYGIKRQSHIPFTSTGHEQFESLILSGERKLLIECEDDDIKPLYKKVKSKIFGSNEYYLNKYVKAKYQSKVIFSRSNRTNEEYIFSYDLETVEYKNVSVAVKGGISAKKIFKMDSGDLTLDGDISMSYASDSYLKTTETGKMNVVIYPYKRVTLRIVGDARVSTGVSKFYIFGICIKKGSFEIVEIQSTIYELLEESVYA